MELKTIVLWSLLFFGTFLCSCLTTAQVLYPIRLKNELWHGQQRSLRYHPEREDFVITNGNRRFNRALYGTHTAFRVEAGDLPEFALFMPGMGGNLKFGLIKGTQNKWLINSKEITARYTPGKMSYEIHDPLLGNGKLHIVVLALADAEGLVLKACFEGTEKNVELVYAFGGAGTQKFSRSGDMGPDPESSFYLKAENCIGNHYQLRDNQFKLNYGSGHAALEGIFPTALKLSDAAQQHSPAEFYQSTASSTVAVTGKKVLINGENSYIIIKNPSDGKAGVKYAELANTITAAENSRIKIAGRIKVNTPDLYINTLGAALSIASDAIWETPSYLHGAIGWRMRLNGWRGAYTADPLGWHDRARTHFEAYGQSQVLDPLTGPVVADTSFHLARQQEKMGTSLFSSGYISRDPEGKSMRPHHYDMNLVYIDELLWHFNWTGDIAFAKKMWPVLQRHLAWEKRNFDPDNDGLYDAYAAIWASDALYYSGGAVTHSSAFNYRANIIAARIARLIHEDPLPYQSEAAKILNAVNQTLWMPGNGVYAEYKDALGLKGLHPAAALWTIYHAIDSALPDPFQAYQSLRYIDQEIPHIPLIAKGLPQGQFYTLSTSRWMPYVWSVNNVVMAESMHTALANWEAGRNEEGFNLFKSEILANMYLGGSPGNFVQISYYDAFRGEAYRDFADPIGISSRALVEGLFGIVPNALAHILMIRPGFPAAWDHAAIHIPDLDYHFNRKGETDHYRLKLSFVTPLALKLQVKARGAAIASVKVNGKIVGWRNINQTVGMPILEINAPAAKNYDIQILWKGKVFKQPVVAASYAIGDQLKVSFTQALVLKVNDPQKIFSAVSYKKGEFKAVLSGRAGNRTAFVQLKMGGLTWWYPICFELKPRLSIRPEAQQEKNKLTFRLLNNSRALVKGVLHLHSYQKKFFLAPGDSSAMISLTGPDIAAGANSFTFTAETGKTDTLQMISWSIEQPLIKQQTVDLSALFNAQVTDIFKNKYLSPRPAVTTLQLPWQGIGDWPNAKATANVDDTGLRRIAGTADQFHIPQGIVFKTPGTSGKRNIIFTSQWDNYPRQQHIPLSGTADHAYFLMAGTTNPMQSQFDNGKIVVTYTDGSSSALTLRNPETWWPIQENYYTDGFAFKLKDPVPPRVELKTGKINSELTGEIIDGGAATVLDLPLDDTKILKDLSLTTLANDVVIGLMGITLTKH